ncbi:MAG: hypothetical protein JXQ29_07585 [Planctomycetes bacterium]|nr:hypothetical protein [Planctomycetota bacterium]
MDRDLDRPRWEDDEAEDDWQDDDDDDEEELEEEDEADDDDDDGMLYDDRAQAEVPAILRSEYSGEPFASCLVCGTSLDDAELHVVEKVIRHGEAVFEMAVCVGCAGRLAGECSEESLARLGEVQEAWVANADPDGERCAGCGRPRDHAGAFVIAGYFVSHHRLVRSLAVCEDCHDDVQDRLSEKTRETFGEFVRDHFPGVPENIDAPVFFGG